MQTAIRGETKFRTAQVQACHVLYKAASQQQATCRDQMFMPVADVDTADRGDEDASAPLFPERAPYITNVVSGEWDETC